MGMIPLQGVYGRRNTQMYFHRVVLGTGGVGAIASQDAASDSGIVATRSALGRYLFTIAQPVSPGNAIKRQILFVHVTAVGPDTAAFVAPGTVSGTNGFIRQEKIANNTPNGTVMWQFVRTDSNADSELPDSTVFYVMIVAAA